MAETVMPSVRGRQRMVVEAALLSGAVATAAPAGFLFGLIAAAVTQLAGSSSPGVSSTVIVWIVAIGLVLDIAHLVTGRLRPLTLGRQVPREWGRLLPLPVTAFLYGGRLGVGPLTILSTWMWWAALIGSALVGVWEAVAVSTWFALWRIVVNGIVSRRLGRRPESNLSVARSFQRRGWSSLTGLAAVLIVVSAFVTGCGALGNPAARPVLLDGSADEMSSAAVEADSITPPPTSPAQLEDFVRTSSTPLPIESPDGSSTDPSSTTPTTKPEASPAPASGSTGPAVLAALAPDALEGMSVIDDPGVNRYLTIDEAAGIQPDPTEEIALLETRGYRGGWIRAFRSPTSDVAVAAVYEFADENEAEFYLEDGLITIGGYGGQFFDVAELPDIRGFKQDVVDEGETVRTLGGAFHRDNRWYLLYVVGSPQTVTPDVLIPALRSWRRDLGLQPEPIGG